MEQSQEELSKVEDSEHDVDTRGSNLFLIPFSVVFDDAFLLKIYPIFEQK